MPWKPPYLSLFFTILLTLVSVQSAALPVQASRPLLKLGSQGVEVLEVQALLQVLGYYGGELDGTYRDSTVLAVTEFQKSAGLSQDGILGTSTWSKLLPAVPQSMETKAIVTPAPQPKPVAQPLKPDIKSEESGTPILRRGAKGDAVYRLQQRLGKLGFLAIGPDGDFGELTEKAVKAAQQKYRLETDGVVGGATWNAIGL